MSSEYDDAAELESEAQPASETLQAEVPFSASGRRFDAVLAEMFPEFSRSRLADWIKSGAATLNGKQLKPKDAVRGGEKVLLRVERSVETQAAPENIPLEIIYDDDDVLVINKSAGLVVHPGAGNSSGTLVNALLHHNPALAELPRAGIVHRLDKDTSGLMVVAKSLRAHTSLVEQLSNRDVHRQYLAVVVGPMVAGSTVNAPIDRHPTDRLRQAVVREGSGKEAVTHYRVREKFRAHTLVECRLETGRTHQIRVHMAHIRHNIIGDPLYGGSFKLPKAATDKLVEVLRGFKRQALHAEKLEFVHPADQKTLSFSAPMPSDMQQLIAALREDTKLFQANQ
jgi:23S rRNA pseudouridine1911/1915/1917 synthase